jgi:hypothetical protein
VGLGRFELPTYGLGNRRSIHLSYSPIYQQTRLVYTSYVHGRSLAGVVLRTRAAHKGFSDSISGQVALPEVTRQKALKRGRRVGMDYGWACGITPGLACTRSNFLFSIGQNVCEVGNRDEHILVVAGENILKGLGSFLLSFFSEIDGYE